MFARLPKSAGNLLRVQERTRLKYSRPTDEPLGRFASPLEISARGACYRKATTLQFVRPQDACFSGGYVLVPAEENI